MTSHSAIMMVDPEKLPPEVVQAIAKRFLELQLEGKTPGWKLDPNGGPPETGDMEPTATCGCGVVGCMDRSATRVATRYLSGKYHGKKRGDGSSIGLFISLPKHMAKQFPTLHPEDGSPSHVTFLIIGEVTEEERQKELLKTLRELFSDCWEDCIGQLHDLEYFDHHDKDRRVPHMSVSFNRDLAEFRDCVKKGLLEAGFPVNDSYPEYKPHVTLAYMPGMESQWDGHRPAGCWQFDHIEVWGLPDKVHRIPFGKRTARLAANWQARKAGWHPSLLSALATRWLADHG